MTESTAGPYSNPQRWWILAACCAVAFAQHAEPQLWMIGFDIPSSAFGTAWRGYRIVANLGVVLFVAFLLVGGVLGDLLGRRRILLIGAVGVVAANLLSLVTTDLTTLIVTRALAGMTGALAIPISLGLIRLYFDGEERTRALVIYTFVTAVGTLASLLGIPFEYWWGWRTALVIPIITGAAGAYLAWRYVPESRAQGGFGRIEAITAAAWALAFLGVMFGLVVARTSGTWRNPITLAAGGVGGLGLLLMAVWTQYATSTGLFRGAKQVPRHFLSLLLVVSATLSFGLVAYVLQLYSFFFTSRQAGAIISGLALAPIFAGNLFTLRWAARFTTRQPTYVTVTSGLGAMAAAMLLTSLMGRNTPYVLLVPLMMLFGLGFLVASASWAAFFFAALPADLIGLSSAINRAAGMIGTALSGVILSGVVEVAGTADFKLQLSAMGLAPEQQASALQALDLALRLGVREEDLAQLPWGDSAMAVMDAYRESFGVGVTSALFAAAAVCLACAVVAWLWLRRKGQAMTGADERPAGSAAAQ